MTISLPLPRSSTVGAIGAALVWTTLTIGAAIAPTPAEARGGGTFYTAELAQPATERISVAGGVAWTCEGTSCTAPKGTSRPLRICRELNREHGQVTSFAAEGEALDPEKLARCNG